jgi:hypothetical protein
MKTSIFYLVALALIFTFSSCEDDLLDITEEITYESEIQVFSTDSAYLGEEVVDMAESSSVINQYKDKIKTIEITNVEYWLTVHEGTEDQTMTEASLKVADESGGNEELIANIENVKLADLLNNPTQLDVMEPGIEKMAELIKNEPHKFKIIYNTVCNEAPLNFTVKFKFTIKMTANPLN